MTVADAVAVALALLAIDLDQAGTLLVARFAVEEGVAAADAVVALAVAAACVLHAIFLHQAGTLLIARFAVETSVAFTFHLGNADVYAIAVSAAFRRRFVGG